MKCEFRFLVAIATYNEIDNLPDLVAAIFEQAPDIEVLVIDDNSPDGTGRWCDEMAAQEPRLSVIHRPGKQGLGTAAIVGFRHAIENDFDFVLTMDADFSHHPRYIPAIRARMLAVGTESADVTIGSRYVSGGAIQGWARHRRIMSRLINGYARVLLGLQVADCSGAFRCYRTSTLGQLDFTQIESKGYAYLEEILWRLKARGARFAEIPITFVDRQKGMTKINWQEATAAVRILLRLGLRRLWNRE